MSERLFSEIVVSELRRRGVPVRRIWLDNLHPQANEPIEYREQPSALNFGTYFTPFYRTLYRWEMDDRTAGAILLDPVLVRHGGRWREDVMAQTHKLADAFISEYAP